MKGHKLDGETHSKIEKHIAKHRKYGGATKTVKGHGKESAMEGRDEAEMDEREPPVDRSEPNNPAKMAKLKSDKGEEHKRGGHVKKRKEGGHVAGEWPKHSSARAPRKSGGYCEDSPFTTANKSTPAKGREVMRMSEGLDKE